jgi:hypothetical protein
MKESLITYDTQKGKSRSWIKMPLAFLSIVGAVLVVNCFYRSNSENLAIQDLQEETNMRIQSSLDALT